MIILNESIGIRTVEETYAALRQALQDEQRLIIDASGVRFIDTAGIQLLLWIVRQTLDKGTPMEWHGVSNALRDAAQLCGLSTLLELPEK